MKKNIVTFGFLVAILAFVIPAQSQAAKVYRIGMLTLGFF